MTKSELINKISTDTKYTSICKRLTKNRGDHEDLLQELTLHFLEQTDALIGGIKNADAYIYRTLLSLISKRGKFYEKYRTYVCQSDIKIHKVDGYDYQKDNSISKVESAIKDIYWCDREVLKVYADKGSIRKTAKALNIPITSTFEIIERAKKTIKQKMAKPKVLICMQHNVSALQYHRQIKPHERLDETHSEEIEFVYNRPDKGGEEVNVLWMTDEQLKEFGLVIFLRQISYNPAIIQPSIDKLKALNIKILLDIDDYWEVPKSHPMYQQYKVANYSQTVTSTLKQVDWVTTTTQHFANKISEYNTNVTVLPNCISPNDDQFKSRDIGSPRVRFGWIGGVYHSTDMLSAKSSFGRFNTTELLKDIQICLGGFNIGDGNNKETIKQLKSKFRRERSDIIRDYRTDPKYKLLATENINYMLPEYLQMEEIITDDYKICDRDYVKYLQEYTQVGEHISYDKPYRRMWGKSIQEYGSLYNEIDVALIPLKDTEFSKCKSELKIVEAGWMSKPVIVSDVTPYSEWIEDGVNGIKINPNRNNIDWYVAIRKLAKEPSMRKDMGQALHETIITNFDIDKHNLKRLELYKNLTA